MATDLKNRVQSALDEARMLVLGVQVLIGFSFRAVLERSFHALPPALRALTLAALGTLLVTFTVLLTPAADHRIEHDGNDTAAFNRFTTTMTSIALLPFAASLAVDVGVAAFRVGGAATAWIAGGVCGAAALTLWYGLELVQRRRRGEEKNDVKDEDATSLDVKIRHVLTEARVVLPGAQALLGFQFITTLADGFKELTGGLRWLHLASLGCVSIATVLLMMPAAWHRIVEAGESTERFHRLAGRMLLSALVPLALGLAGDFYVVAWVVSKDVAFSLVATSALLALDAALWFVVPMARRIGALRARNA